MSWTRSIPPEHADAPLRSIFDRIAAHASRGQISNVWRAQALDPAGLEATVALYRALMRAPEPLTEAQAQLIAVVVSAVNGCGYCVAHHGPALARALGDEPLARAVALDYRTADLTARDRVLLDHCVALTCEPGERTNADIERIREYGFDDAQIVKATEIGAFYSYINRIVSTLGAELEPELPRWEFGSQT